MFKNIFAKVLFIKTFTLSLGYRKNRQTLKTNKMQTLTEILKNETAELKALYLEKTKEYATAEHAHSVKVSGWSVADWCKFLNIEARIEGSNIFFPKGFYNTKNSRVYAQTSKAAFNLAKTPLADHVARELKNAEVHYLQSIEKLAFRIEKKDLDLAQLSVISGRVGMNFETTITDGSKKVRAFTVLAHGPIQRPHYRYLIK